MLDEIVDVFTTVPAGVVLDATLGAGGHTEAILDAGDRPLGRSASTATATALAAATARLERFGDRFHPVHARFDDLRQIMDTDQIPRPDLDDGLSGALFDLGVSSPQLDRGDRGFSYRQDGPLDMRMDQDAAVVGVRRRQRLRRRRADPRHPATSATSASPPASPGRSSPPARSSRRSSWRRS